jgi:hypothetical protein
LAGGVDGEEGNVELGGALDGSEHGFVNVVELEVEEDLFAAGAELAD